MRAALSATILLTAVSLSACQSGWVRLDGAKADNSVQATKTSSNEARMQQLDSFETESFTVYQQINDCMQREGYRKP